MISKTLLRDLVTETLTDYDVANPEIVTEDLVDRLQTHLEVLDDEEDLEDPAVFGMDDDR